MKKSDSRKGSSSEYVYYFSDINATIEAAKASDTDGYHFTGNYDSNPKVFKTIDQLATPLSFDDVIDSKFDSPALEEKKEKLEELRETFKKRDASFSLSDLITFRDKSQAIIQEMTKIEVQENKSKQKSKQ